MENQFLLNEVARMVGVRGYRSLTPSARAICRSRNNGLTIKGFSRLSDLSEFGSISSTDQTKAKSQRWRLDHELHEGSR